MAVTGWVLGLTVHLLSVAGIDVAEKIPYVWVLHVGIFLVLIPAIFVLRKSEELKGFQRSGTLANSNPFAFFAIIGKNAPKWMSVVATGGLAYAVCNFVLFMSSQQNGMPGITNGQYILQNHGHWIAFYGIAMLILYPYKPKEEHSHLKIS